MRQVLHLLIVDRDHTTALATWHGPRWLLPILTCGERTRLHAAIVPWLARCRIRVEVAGQWLGCLAQEATDWLIVMRATSERLRPDLPLAWTPLDTLAAATPLIDYQGWALRKSLERGTGPSVSGPFGRLTWLDEVRAWIHASIASTPCTVTAYRVSAHEVVLGADTSRGRVYFKGLPAERASEARLTRMLAALAPSSFARTLGLDVRMDGSAWWLTAECPGNAGASGPPVARALARLQRRLMGSGPVLRELRRVDLDAARRWASELVDDLASTAAIDESFKRVAIADVPESWVPMDLDPTNVLADARGVIRFIDLDDSFFGPAPLAMAVFAKRRLDRSPYWIYEQSWSPPLTGIDWQAFEVTATVVDAWLGWQRVNRNAKRGEVQCALDFVVSRIRQRLRRAINRVVESNPL